MTAARSYILCTTPRSGSTLVCQALKATGVAGRPEEYFEALRKTGRPRRPEQYFNSVGDQSILDHLGERSVADDPQPRSPLWSRTAYDRYLEWAMEVGTTPNGVFAAKLMWGYFGDFVGLLRNVPRYSDLRLAELLPTVFPELTFVRVVRANKIRQAVSLWKAVQTAAWREEERPADSLDGSPDDPDSPPYKSFLPGAPSTASLSLPGDRAPVGTDPDRGGLVGRLLRALRHQSGARPLRELRCRP